MLLVQYDKHLVALDSAAEKERKKVNGRSMEKIRNYLLRWMSGRYGADNLGRFTLMAGLMFSVCGSFIHSSLFSFLGLGLYFVTIFRMFSRNRDHRARENRKYIETVGGWSLKITQFFRRVRNRKDYHYFKCPQCKQLLRLKRGCGEKQITCVKCGNQFIHKA